MWFSVECYYMELAKTDEARWIPEARRIQGIIEALPMTPELRATSLLSGGATLYARARRAASSRDIQTGAGYRHRSEMGGQDRDRGSSNPYALWRAEAGRGIAGIQACRLRSGLPHLDPCEDRLASGQECRAASALLAFAFAKLSRWKEAVETIERGKCLRQRYTLALRRTAQAANLLAIEGELYTLSRGSRPTNNRSRSADPGLVCAPTVARGPVAGRVSEAAAKGNGRMPHPSLMEMQASLREDEAALSLGLWSPGLFAALVVHGNPDPIWTKLWEDVTHAMSATGWQGKRACAMGFCSNSSAVWPASQSAAGA